ncbi:MAG: sigma-70 family RNA polymerase sigma factor [Elusimicrobia bacterium]|nr:sigma-70 family RNA polymerase sigma factor [Elusimicrobiota bacterium]
MNDCEDDRAAVRRIRAGDDSAYAELLARHRDRVFSFLLRLLGSPQDAEDVAQEAFVKAFSRLDSYDSARPFVSWLFAVAHHAALDFLRARRPAALSLDDPDGAPDLADSGPDAEAAAEAALDGRLIERLLAALPPLYREPLMLRHTQEMGISEIARVLSLPEGTVKVRLFRGRDMLKRKLSACGFGGEKF